VKTATPREDREPSREKVSNAPWAKAKFKTTNAAPLKKESRRTPESQTRLYMSVGSEMGVAPRDIVGAIMGERGLPPGTVGTVDIRERHTFVDVASEHTHSIIAKLNRATIKGQRVKMKVA
jgi:ATP-dependent RNA helicase DeaD